MRVGVPTEIKDAEGRVAITPAGVRELCVHGHEVWVQSGAGLGSSLTDDDFAGAGARIVDDAAVVWSEVELLCKVKEPVASEYEHLRDDLVLFTYLHLAAAGELTQALVDAKTTGVAYETVTGRDGVGLPLLAPMSEVAGRMAPQVGAHALEAPRGGRGVLMGGVSGVLPAHVVVIGAGTSGTSAAWVAAGMGANVTVLDLDVAKLRAVDAAHQGRVTTLTSNRLTLEEQLAQADMVIGAVLVPGARAPRIVTRQMVAAMPSSAVLVDISIDQGGVSETSRGTTHAEPTYTEEGVVHYCVTNMPGAVPRTSTYALTNVTLPYLVRIANQGLRDACDADPGLARGINTIGGAVTEPGVADAHGLPHTALDAAW